MSIPKVIHYCWFGGTEMPAAYKKYMESWKRYCPDYEIKLWNEQNFDFSGNLYARQAYEQKKWAFVSDYARLKIIYEFGGIYLDTDVEILRPLDDLLELKGFLGFQDNKEIATGLGFGAEKGNPVIKAMLADYADAAFILPDGTYDTTPCPERNTEALIPLGFRADGCMQTVDGVTLFPADYFCPIGFRHPQELFRQYVFDTSLRRIMDVGKRSAKYNYASARADFAGQWPGIQQAVSACILPRAAVLRQCNTPVQKDIA